MIDYEQLYYDSQYEIKKLKETYLFEIKHSSKLVKEHSAALENENFLIYIEDHFGTIRGRAVLYNGPTDNTMSVPRIKASEFLKQTDRDFKQDKDFSPKQTIERLIEESCNYEASL